MIAMVGDQPVESDAAAGEETNEAEGTEGGAADVVALNELESADGGDACAEENECEGFHWRGEVAFIS